MKKSQIAYAIWPWGTQTKEQAELAAKEITEIGYKNFESVKNAMYAYDMNVKEYKAMLDKYDLTPISFYFHIPQAGEEHTLFDTLEKELEFVAAMDVTRVTLQGTYIRPDVFGEKEHAYNLNNMVRFAKIAKTFGLQTNVHRPPSGRFSIPLTSTLQSKNSIQPSRKSTPTLSLFAAKNTLSSS